MRNNYVGLILGVSLFTCLLGVNPAQSAVVSNCDETSLRAAIAQGGTVSFACDGVVHLNSTLDIIQDVAIDGTGRDVTISGSNLVRIFKVQTNTSLELVSLTLTEGRSASTNLTAGEGGALLNLGGTVKARSCVFIGNSAIGHSADYQFAGDPPSVGSSPGLGGAICNRGGSLYLSRCTFKNNLAQGGGAATYRGAGLFPGASASGGAIFNAGALTTSEVIFAGNKTRGADPVFLTFGSIGGQAPGFGGALANSGAFAGTNLTFVANLAEGGAHRDFIVVESFGQGGAIQNDGTGICVNCTVASNVAIPVSLSLSASQIASTNGSFTLLNSIVTGAPGTNNCLGIITDGGHNIGSDGSANFTAPSSHSNLDPLLGPLANNGGPTLTMALLPGSPAIDAGSSANFPPTDQRGVARPQGLESDIGAFESNYATTVALTENAVRAAVETGGSFAFNLSGQIALSAPLVVSKNTTLDALGQAVVLSGNNAHRIFEILPGVSLTLVNLTIRDGVSTNGGGILVDHGELHATGCRFVNNLAQGAAGRDAQNGANPTSGGMARGGAIFGSSAVLMLTNNVFLENRAKGGIGGTAGSVILVAFPDGGSASGGAVAGDDLLAVGVGCHFESNHSISGMAGTVGRNAGTVGSVKGGAWEQTRGSAHFEECAFIGNLAQAPNSTIAILSGAGGSSSGGALFLGAGTMVFEKVRFERNAALGGAGRRNSSGGTSAGGALANFGSITLTRCIVTGNQATAGDGGPIGESGYGGAIQNLGTLSAAECWFEKNSVSGGTGYRGGMFPGRGGSGFGGAIWNTGRLDVAASTFSLNSAVGVEGGLTSFGPAPGALAGGGALANSGLLTGTNLTFANNTAVGGSFPFNVSSPSAATAGGTAVGGALFQWGGTSVLAHVTMAYNGAIGGDGGPHGDGLGGGIAVSNGVVSLTATIVSGSSGASNCFGSVLDGGNNICSDASAGFSAASSRNNLNPVLGLLADYGGRVPTVALLGGSPAIDAAGLVNCPATDERGISRPFGSACDIGAFESSPPYTVLGRVSGYLNPPDGIQISAGALATASDQTGQFALHGLPAGTHLVVPASADAVFVNSNRLVTLGPDIVGVEFWSYRTNALVLEKTGAGTVRGIFAAAAGQTFQVEVSDDFSSWSSFSTQTTASSGLFEFWDTNSAVASPRLFRVKSP